MRNFLCTLERPTLYNARILVGVRENESRGPWRMPGVFFFFVDANPKRAFGVSESAGKNWCNHAQMKTHKASKKTLSRHRERQAEAQPGRQKALEQPKSGKRKRHLREAIVSGNKFARKTSKAMGGDA